MKRISCYIYFFLFILITVINGCGGGGGGGGAVPPPVDSTSTPVSTVSVSGRVLEEINGSNVPLSGAYLIFSLSSSSSFLNTSALLYEAYSNNDGYYIFNSVPAGPGTINVWRDKSTYDSNPSAPQASINIVAANNQTVPDIIINSSIPFPTLTPVPVTATPGPISTSTPDPTMIEGTVVDSDGGSPVVSSTVTLVETGQKTLTDASGKFSFEVSPGTYTVLITKANYAQSKAQSVRVSEGNITVLEMIEMPFFNPSWQTIAPTITVTGVSNDDVINSSRNINVSLSGVNNIRIITLRVGNKHSTYDKYTEYQSSLSYTLDPASLPPERTYIYISAYDMNNNRSEVTIDINPPQSSVIPPSLSPENPRAYSYTVGETIQAYSDRVTELKSQGKLPTDLDPYTISLPDGEKVELRALPSHASCYAIFNWDAVSGAEGYRIYRSTTSSGPYIFVGDTLGGSYTQFIDGDSATITPGATLYYRVAAYNSGGEGPQSSAPPVTVLSVFRVNLSQPSDNTVVSTTSPDLSWSISGNNIGQLRRYRVLLWKYTGSSSPVSVLSIDNTDPTMNQTSISAGTLEGSTVYQWDVYSFAAGSYSSTYGRYMAYSYPTYASYYTDHGLRCYASNNGMFIFTTP